VASTRCLSHCRLARSGSITSTRSCDLPMASTPTSIATTHTMAPRRRGRTPPPGEAGHALSLGSVADSSTAFAIDPALDTTLPSTLDTLESVTRDTTITTEPVAGSQPAAPDSTGPVNAPSGGVGDGLTAEESNRLSDFAQHVLGGKGDGTHGHESLESHARSRLNETVHEHEADYGTFDAEPDGGLFAPAPEQGFTELLDKHHEQEREREREEQSARDVFPAGEHAHGHGQGEGEGTFEADEEVHQQHQQHQHQGHLGDGPPPPPPERTRRANKRRREDEPGGAPVSMSRENGSAGVQGDNVNGAADPLRMKKDSHVRVSHPLFVQSAFVADRQKEVERRRRENINVGIDELALLLPDTNSSGKEGKSVILKRAATHMAELTRTVNHLRAEQAQLDQARMDFQVRDPDCMLRGVDPQSQLDNLQNELNEERSRSMRFERSWQQAEDRAAASQFELARANAELDKLRQGQ